ncbi:hypothetical protein N7527_010519 [Penicillium freii]|nr:hypothetical protein N7527_010519 [Penicillium freii]
MAAITQGHDNLLEELGDYCGLSLDYGGYVDASRKYVGVGAQKRFGPAEPGEIFWKKRCQPLNFTFGFT